MTITLKFEAGLVPILKHGTHDQKDHGNWAHGFAEEISNWNPHESIPDSPRNAGGMTRKMWDAWEHGPDGQPFVELFRKYACEELGLAVPKTPYDRGGYSAFMLNRGWGAPNRNEAKAMLNAIANGSDQPTLYRGLAKPTFTDDSSSDVELFNKFVTMKAGDRFDMPLASTTRSLGVATWYAADRVENSAQNVIIKIQSGAKGVSLKKEGSYYPQDYEVITSGKFEVVNISKVSAPYWSRGVFEPRKRVYTDGTEHYEVATYSNKRYSIEESKKIYESVKSGKTKSLETKDFKLTNDRGGDGMTLSSWTRQPAKEFTIVEVKMVEPHTVQKSQDFGNDFFSLFNTIPFIRDEEVSKHGTHDQSSHGNWSTRMMSESDLMASYDGVELTKEQDDAVGRYLATGHRVNELVRKGQLEHYLTDETKVSDVVKGLDSAIETSPALPKGDLFRVVSADALLRLKKNDVINDKGFMSTTAANLFEPDNGALLLHLATVSSGRKSIMVITNNAGKKGMFMPAVKAGQPIAEHEREVVLPRNTKLKYKGEEYHFMGNGMLTYYKFERLP